MFLSVLPGLLLVIVTSPILTTSRLVSPELRRLSLSTNQFGIDVLKSLDKIEPPDKVLVLCPVCVSSSLVMVMMGSSKYQVVSALRHALYVWSLGPKEIKQGYKALLDHVGVNENNILGVTSIEVDGKKSDKFEGRNLNTLSEETLENQFYGWKSHGSSRRMADNMFGIMGAVGEHMSLPNIIRLRELMDRSIQSNFIPQNGELEHLEQKNNEGNNTIEEHRKDSSVSRQKRVSLAISDDMTQMSTTTNIYIQRGLNVNYNYNLLLQQFFKTNMHPVDFVHNTEETRQHINSIVASNTEGKIVDLVDRKSLAKHLKVMIVSSFHFRGTLDVKIKNIKAANFNTNQNNTINQDTTSSSVLKIKDFILVEETLLKFGKFIDLGCIMVEIPFTNRLVSLIVLMPNEVNSTQLLLTKLSAQILNDMINSLKVKKISLDIPVIKFDRGPINMAGLLKELSIDGLFLDQIRNSTETGLNRWMHPHNIVHETSIDIGTINPHWLGTEDRLKVGAHSSGRKVRQEANITSDTHIKLDKPFFYFVMDSMNSLILTMGRIRQ